MYLIRQMLCVVLKISFLLGLAPKMSIDAQVVQIQALYDFNCTVKNYSIDVHLGWPYWVTCQDYVEYIYDEEQKCFIFDGASHKQLYFETATYYDGFSGYLIDDLKSDTENIYLVVSKEDDSCILHNFTFNHITLSHSSCEDGNPTVIHSTLQLDLSFTIDCQDVGAPVNIHLNKNNHDFQVQWFYNCSSTLPTGVESQKDPENGFTKLFFPKVSLSHPGNYTCAITYKNTTRHFVQHNTCIRLQESAIQPPTVKCSSTEVLADLVRNPDVIFQCVATFGFGRIHALTFTSEWTKEGNDDFSCVNVNANFTRHENRYSCIHYIDNQYNDECIGDPGLAQRQNSTPATATLQLTLRNVDENDLGRYGVIIRTPGKENATAYIKLEHDPTRVLRENALIMGLCVGLTTLVFIILGILYYFRFYVAVYTKRWFGSYAPDDKEYDIVFSYHFSTSDDKHAQDQSRTVISSIRLELDGLGYKLYDEHKDDIVGTRALNIVAATKSSHRLLIVLTHDFIKDDWNMFSVQQGFRTMLDSRYRMIFIIVPGIKEYIKQHSRADETCRMIQRAIELNHKIEWPQTGELHRKHFRLQMELAMPKLKRCRYPAAFENTNVKGIGLENGHSKKLRAVADEDHTRA